jgi:hypothetical protein
VTGKLFRRVLGSIAVLLILTCAGPRAAAAPFGPRTTSYPPRVPVSPWALSTEAGTPLSTLRLPQLKAVILVGPIDGDDGAGTKAAEASMELAAQELAAYGVTVYRFYTPNNDWEQITAAAADAQFLFYGGHGVYWSEMPYPSVGGFYLKDRFVSPDDIRRDLALHPNAIIMLHGACFSAGSSSNDTISVTSAEAQRRVAQYSDPFLDIGAAGYYANWFDNALQMYVRYLFQGKTLGATYESFWDFNRATAERYMHPDHPTAVLWLDKDYWYDPLPQYNNAFVGQPNATLEDLFQVTTMQVSPTRIGYLAEPAATSRTVSVLVKAEGPDPFIWTASTEASWLTLSRISGQSGEEFRVTTAPGLPLGAYHASIHIVADKVYIEDRDQTVAVDLFVVEKIHSTYLPLSRR